MTYEGFSIRGSGLTVPFGTAGVAVTVAVVMGMIGLLLPTVVIESMAYQLYLDTLFPTAVAPFGWAAHLVVALAFMVIGAAIGATLGWFFRVSASEWTLRRLINRLRGIGAEDEADAPDLRAADRHPDAPARRPFSVSTDMAAEPAVRDANFWPVGEVPLTPAFDEGELLLDSPLANDGADSSDDDVLTLADYPAMTPDSALADPVDDWADVVAGPGDLPAMADDDSDLFDLTDIIADTGDAKGDVEPAADVAPPVTAAQPIDLSIGRLDELLARLEAGLANRSERPVKSAGIDATVEPAAPAVEDAVVVRTPPDNRTDIDAIAHVAAPHDAAPGDDTTDEWPHDPALAAALATLRRMNQHVG